MTVMVSYLRSRGIDRVLEDSSGNAGASLSAYAAAAGMACRILVPETASYPKIAQIAAGGADVVTIKGSRQDVAEAALRQSAEIFYASHNWQPFFVEGIKTLAYELWEQLGFTRARQRRGAARLRQQRAGRRPRLRRAACATARSARGPGSSACRRRGARPTQAAFRAGSRAPRADAPSPPRSPRGSPRPSPRAWPRCCAPCARRAARSSRWRRRRSWRRCAASPAAGSTSSPPRRWPPPASPACWRAAPSGRTSARCWC